MSPTYERQMAILRRAFVFTSSDPAVVIGFFLFFFFFQSTQKLYCKPQIHPRSGKKHVHGKLIKYALLLIGGVDL